MYEIIAESIKSSFRDAYDFNIKPADVNEIHEHVSLNLALALKRDGAITDVNEFLKMAGVDWEEKEEE